MRIRITVREQTMRDEHTVEVRRVSAQSAGRLTATGASKILRREFPELPRTISASKSVERKSIFFAMHAVFPTDKCKFHYVWRKYYLAEDLN
jgi:hypothetical protein